VRELFIDFIAGDDETRSSTGVTRSQGRWPYLPPESGLASMGPTRSHPVVERERAFRDGGLDPDVPHREKVLDRMV
jgi:hypothetical protein